MNIGVYLKSYRSKNKIPQKQIADSLGISREHYAQIETDRLNPSVKLLKIISKKLSLHIEISICDGNYYSSHEFRESK